MHHVLAYRAPAVGRGGVAYVEIKKKITISSQYQDAESEDRAIYNEPVWWS